MASTDRLIEVFNEAKALPAGAERDGFLASACGDDSELKEHVLSLLRAHESAGGFLNAGPALSPEIEAELARLKPEETGERIGPYKLREQIGEGGFGVVWVAEQQEPVRRAVALKIIKMGMDTREVVARFEQERQALAMMDHPNIARVLDAGATEHGRPFFVMELVRGIKITDYCDQANLPTTERLALFITVCHAVQHAHQKGIIHRDLKPSNILVTLHDGVPVPKVIDFGVAKATQGRLAENTVYTQFQQMIGTPLYMSPEQAEMSGLDVDTRTDIYALGVLLYELLTGCTPFDADALKKAGYDEMRRIIREEEPARPSTALHTMAQEKLTSVAHHRASEPPKLIHAIHGDLDWIVMKTIEKDRSRRYDTANSLAMDIQRHLENEPVLARPPSAGYRFQKLVRRNKLAFAAASAVAAALIIGLALSTWLFLRERAALKIADENALRAERSRQQAETARLAEAEQRGEAEKQRAKAEANFRKARQTVDEYFTTISQTTLLEAPGLQPLRKQLLEAALGYYQGFLEQARDNPELLADLAAAHLRLSVIYVSLDRNDDGLAAMLRGLELIEPLIQKRSGDADLPRRLAGFFTWSSNLFARTTPPSDPVKAAQTLQRAAEIWEQFARDNPAMAEFQGDLAGIYMLLSILFQISDNDRRLAYCIQARSILEKLVRVRPGAATYQDLLALGYRENSDAFLRKGQAQESDQLLHQAVGYFEALARDFPAELSVRRSLGVAYYRLADALRSTQPAEAEKFYQQALGLLEKLVAESATDAKSRRDLYTTYDHLTDHLRKAGRDEEADVLVSKSLPITEQLILEFPGMSDYRIDLASRYLALAKRGLESRPKEAEQTYRRAWAILEKAAADFPVQSRFLRELVGSYVDVAVLLWRENRIEESTELVQQAIAALERGMVKSPEQWPAFRAQQAHNYRHLAFRYRRLGNYAAAREAFQSSSVIFREDSENGLPQPKATALTGEADNFDQLGQLAAIEGRGAEAMEDYHQALAIHERIESEGLEPQVTPGWVDGRYTSLAKLLETAGTLDIALRIARVLRTPETTLGPVGWRGLFDCHFQLAELLRKNGHLDEASQQLVRMKEVVDGQKKQLGDKHPEVAKSLSELASAFQNHGRLADAEPLIREAITAYEQLAQKNPESIDYRVRWGHSRWQLAGVLSDTGRREQSEQVYVEALRGFEQAGRDFPTNPFFRQEQAFTLRSLAGVLSTAGRTDDAERHYQAAIDLYAALAAELPLNLLYFHGVDDTTRALKHMLEGAGRPEAASSVDYLKAIALSENTNAERRRSLGGEHLEVAASLCGLSFLYRAQGDLPAAETTAREALAIRRKLLNNEHADVAQALHLLAWNLHLRGNQTEAESLSHEELAMWRKLSGNEHPDVAWNLFDLTVYLRDQGKLAEAEASIRESLAIRRKKLGNDDPDVTTTFKVLSELLQVQGKPAETLK